MGSALLGRVAQAFVAAFLPVWIGVGMLVSRSSVAWSGWVVSRVIIRSVRIDGVLGFRCSQREFGNDKLGHILIWKLW